MTNSNNGKARNPMTIKAASRFYKTAAAQDNGKVAKGSAAARVMSAAMRNEASGIGRTKKSK